jgi:hypothetical protein
MVAQFPHLLRLANKILEIGGAACVSACVAVLLGNLREPPQPPAPSVVRLAPADMQLIRYVREENAALVEQLRSAPEERITAVAAKATATPTEKLLGALVRRGQKANRTSASDSGLGTAVFVN